MTVRGATTVKVTVSLQIPIREAVRRMARDERRSFSGTVNYYLSQELERRGYIAPRPLLETQEEN
jgi:hypothetical protein